MKAMEPILILIKSEQIPLFTAPTSIRGHMRGGHFVSPHLSGRRRRASPTPSESAAVPEGDALISAALDELRNRLHEPGAVMNNPEAVRNHLRLLLAHERSEAFLCMYLDNRHRVLSHEILFRGTIDGASVHPREVVRRALETNAAAVILAHNHPSGVADPSHAGRAITTRLRDALSLIDVRVLDHFVVGGDRNMDITSFSERGLL
jgi:DNA repair protein RadC